MKNIEIEIDKNEIMTIKIDTKKRLGLSKSGKTIMIATTEGNKAFGSVHVGINVYCHPEHKSL